MPKKKYLLYISQRYSFAILRPIQAAIKARGDSVAWFYADELAKENLCREGEQVLKSIKEVFDYQPRAVIVSSNTVPYFFPGIKVEVFHGFNAKKRGPSAHFNIRGFYDLYCTQGPDTTQPFKQLEKEHGHFKVVETGWPKLDPIFQSTALKQIKTKPVILFSSTFSKNLTAAPHLLQTIKNLSKSGDYTWLVTFHPKMDQSIVDDYKAIQSEHLTFYETDDVIPLLIKADVMVCDTSSILQEFLVLNKPVVTFNNKHPIDCLINITQPDELLSAIKKALTRSDSLLQKISIYAQNLHPYTDGKSSERVLNAIENFIKTDNHSLKAKPLNLIRKFKIRKKLAYFRF